VAIPPGGGKCELASESIKFTVRPAKISYVRANKNEQAAAD
jgi:hypothetical protein